MHSPPDEVLQLTPSLTPVQPTLTLDLVRLHSVMGSNLLAGAARRSLGPWLPTC